MLPIVERGSSSWLVGAECTYAALLRLGRRRTAEKRRGFLAGPVTCASDEEKENVEKIDERCLDLGEAAGGAEDMGAWGAATKDAERVETRMACLRRNLSGRAEGRKLMMASNARSVVGREPDPPPAPPTRARRRRLIEDDAVENADDDEFEKTEEEDEAEDEAEGAGEG